MSDTPNTVHVELDSDIASKLKKRQIFRGETYSEIIGRLLTDVAVAEMWKRLREEDRKIEARE